MDYLFIPLSINNIIDKIDGWVWGWPGPWA